MVKKMSESDTENEVREAYRVFDKEREGFITRAELRMIFAALPERLSAEEIDEMLEAADEDGETLTDITFTPDHTGCHGFQLGYLINIYHIWQEVGGLNMTSSRQCWAPEPTGVNFSNKTLRSSLCH